MARRPGRRQDSALRDALVAKRERFAARWPTKNSLERAAQAASGAEIGTNSDELFEALHATDHKAAMEFLNGPDRYFILTEMNELIELPDRRSDSSLPRSTPGRRGGNHPINPES